MLFTLPDNFLEHIGASIIRMLNKFLGEQSFRAGLTNYLNGR